MTHFVLFAFIALQIYLFFAIFSKKKAKKPTIFGHKIKERFTFKKKVHLSKPIFGPFYKC